MFRIFFLLNVKYVIINLICICFMYYVIFFNNFYVDQEIRLMYCELFLLIIMKKINCEIFFVFFKYSVFLRNNYNIVNVYCSLYRNGLYSFCDI